ncbi:MAG: HAD family hydrolase [Ilumatobacteraceae bacterium]
MSTSGTSSIVNGRNRIDTVIFDLGGVLATNGRPSDVIRRFPHDPLDVVMNVVMGEYSEDTDHPWHRLERGEITMADYRHALVELVQAAGLSPEPASPGDSATSIGFRFEACQPMVDLVHQLRAADVKVGVLTNNIREFRPLWWPMLDFPTLFHDVVDSHEVGMRKPNPAIYELAVQRLGTSVSRTAFLDDAVSNVKAANMVGLHGIWVDRDPGPAIEAVRQLVGL